MGLRKAASVIEGFHQLSLFQTLRHRHEEQHFDVDGFIAALKDISLVPGATEIDILYTFARLRSHIPLCCWHERSQADYYPERIVSGLPYPITCSPSSPGLLEMLAWHCRGEVGREDAAIDAF